MVRRSIALVALLAAVTGCTSTSTPSASPAPSSSAAPIATGSASTPPLASGSTGGTAIQKTPVWLSQTAFGVVWRPASASARKPEAILLMHESADFTQHPACADLSSRGFTVLCENGRFVGRQGEVIFDDLALDLKAGVQYLRKQTDLKKIFLLGHSGGGAIVSYYQNVAENGAAVCQDPRRITPCSNALAGLPKADGVILLDPIPGLGFSGLTSTDPEVIAEDQFGRIDSSKTDPSLDMFSPANGFDPKKPSYSADFVKRFHAAQAARYDRLVALAQTRMDAIKARTASFPDDEPFVVSHANARLWVMDLDLFSQTHEAHTILTATGERQEVARSVRVVGTSATGDITKTNLPYSTARRSSVRSFLSTFAIRTTPDFQITADGVVGVDWQSTNTSLVANLGGVKSSLLAASMTGHYWIVTTEIAFDTSPSSDKTLVYVEGASHGLATCKECETTPGQFGDTEKTLMDYIAKWLTSRM